ncbi:alcohol dehydrogenase [Microbacterium paraoxydans]|uniref:alcohol dehydrogenase n=1 Tax=Microbacterium paraoxydans TaxID=199592 RepID=UPI00352EFEFE
MTRTSMHAFAIFEDDHSVTDIELPTPQPQGTEVLLRVLHSGVCHTDTHLREGYYDLGSRGRMNLVDRGVTYPIVLGHEVVGVVEAVGPEAAGVSVGQHRLIYPWIGCGTCDACRSGQENLCPTPKNLGVARHGGYADHIHVPHSRYLVDVTGLDERWAATLACSGLTAYSAARKAMPADPSLPVVVIGAGGVGLMAIATLAALGHPAIVAVDLQERNLELAREMGATATVSAASEDLVGAITEATGGPVAAVIDFVNNGATAPAAFGALRKGGTMIQVGLFGGEFTIPTALLTLKIITIRGSFVGSLDELVELVALAKRGALPQVPTIDAELSAEAVQHSLDRLAAGGVPGRIVLSAS